MTGVKARFRQSGGVITETQKRGLRGAYLLRTGGALSAGESLCWHIVVDLERSQADCSDLRRAWGAR